MPDIDQAIAAAKQRSKFAPGSDKGCIGQLIALHPDRADDIRRVVEASWVIGARKAADILIDHGLTPINDQAIRRHRREPPACKCSIR